MITNMERIVERLIGDTHHTATSSTWFQQTTSLNIVSIVIAKRLTNARNRLTNNSKEIDDDIHGTPYPLLHESVETGMLFSIE